MTRDLSIGTILIVDDVLENLHLLSQMLSEYGYNVRAAKTGREALSSVNAELPDLILLDIKLPDLSGYEVCTALKANEKTKSVPVIFLSALSETEEKMKAFTLGAADYITKPFVSIEVLFRVKIHLENGMLRSQLEQHTAELHLKNEQLRSEIDERRLANEKLTESITQLQISNVSALNICEDLESENELRRMAEIFAKESWNYLDKIINSLAAPIFVKDDKYKFTLVNNALCSLLNQTAEELIGKTGYEYFPEDQNKVFLAKDKEVFDTGIENINEEFLTDGMGKVRTIITKKSLYTDSTGDKFLVGVINDITTLKETETVLRESEESLKVILESTNDGMLAVDNNNKVIRVNNQFIKYWDIPKEIIESVDDNILLNFVVDQLVDPGSFLAKVKLLYNSTESDSDTIFFKDGRIFERISNPLLLEGSLIGRVWSFRNVTESKLAEELIKVNYSIQTTLNSILRLSIEDVPLIELLKQTFDLIINVPSLNIESKGSIFLVNVKKDALEMIIEKNLSEPIKKACKSVPFGMCHCGRAASTQSIQFSDCIDQKHDIAYDGIANHGHYCTPIVYGGLTLGVINVYLNPGHLKNQTEIDFLNAIANTLAGIIVRKNSEKELQKAMENLEVTVIERTEELADANLKLQIEISERQKVIEKEKELNMLKGRFISVVSHEFRTPLAGVLSSVELLEMYGEKWSIEKKKDIYKRIYGTIRYTNLLLDDVSIMGKDESGTLVVHLTTVNIRDLCNQVIGDIKAVFSADLTINVDIDDNLSDIKADEGLLRHILNNLLSNAIKYSQKKPVDVSVKITENNFIRISVRDYGIGIPKQDLKYIFEPFHRATNVESIKGTGLGLPIVKRCIQLLNGTIEIESEEGIGTTVIVLMPLEII